MYLKLERTIDPWAAGAQLSVSCQSVVSCLSHVVPPGYRINTANGTSLLKYKAFEKYYVEQWDVCSVLRAGFSAALL